MFCFFGWGERPALTSSRYCFSSTSQHRAATLVCSPLDAKASARSLVWSQTQGQAHALLRHSLAPGLRGALWASYNFVFMPHPISLHPLNSVLQLRCGQNQVWGPYFHLPAFPHLPQLRALKKNLLLLLLFHAVSLPDRLQQECGGSSVVTACRSRPGDTAQTLTGFSTTGHRRN